jgi:hypothetical protein
VLATVTPAHGELERGRAGVEEKERHKNLGIYRVYGINFLKKNAME